LKKILKILIVNVLLCAVLEALSVLIAFLFGRAASGPLFVQAYPSTSRDLAQASGGRWVPFLGTILSITFIMPVQQTIPFEEGTFFITFTCHKRMNLIETTESYDLV
jgi:hypothetical protein